MIPVRSGRCAVLATLLVWVLLVPAARAQEEGDAPRPWGPEQAAGPPDTPKVGDCHTAWAALLPDGGEEWLRLDYQRAVVIAQVRIRESWHPGAVSRVRSSSPPPRRAQGARRCRRHCPDCSLQAPA